MQRVEATDTGVRHIRVSATRQQYIRMAETNLVKGRTYCVRRRGASGGNRETRATETETDGYLSGSDARDSFRNHERIETRHTVALGKINDLCLGGLQATHATTPDHTDATAILFLEVESAIDKRFVSHPHRELRIAVHLTRFLTIHQRCRIKILHFTRELGLEIRGIKRRNRRDTVLTVDQRFPGLRRRITHRGKCT